MTRDSEAQKAQPASEFAEGVWVQVCIECGHEYFYDDAEPPAEQQCERCGNTVFRSFFDVADGDEVAADYREATERDVATDDPSTDVTPGDLYDLNNP